MFDHIDICPRTEKKRRGALRALTALTALALVFVLSGGILMSSCARKPETEVYLIAPEPNSLMESYIIKTRQGKLIVIDGGIAGQGYDAVPYIPAALRAVAGKKAGEYVEVEAWFLSHAHNDHFNELGKVMREYTSGDNIGIKNFYFDFPPFETPEYPAGNSDLYDLGRLKTGFDHYAAMTGIEVPEGQSYYDMVNGALVNASTIAAGQDIYIDEVRFEMMQTWDVSDGGDTNSNSLVFRAYVNGKTILFLHDLGVNGGRRLLQKYGSDLKSDYVHMAHHGQAGVTKEVYDAIDADVFLWGTPIWVWTNTTSYRIGETRMWVNNGVDYDTADEHNVVTCLYKAFPSDTTSVEAWKKVLPGMKLKF